MLRPFPLDGFCRSFGEIKSVILIVITIALDPHIVDFDRSAAADVSGDRIKGIGRTTSTVDCIGHRGNSKDGFSLTAFRGDTAHYNGR